MGVVFVSMVDTAFAPDATKAAALAQRVALGRNMSNTRLAAVDGEWPVSVRLTVCRNLLYPLASKSPELRFRDNAHVDDPMPLIIGRTPL